MHPATHLLPLYPVLLLLLLFHFTLTLAKPPVLKQPTGPPDWPTDDPPDFNPHDSTNMPPGGPGTDICTPPQHHCQIPGAPAECCPEPWPCINNMCTDPSAPNVCGLTICDPATNDCLNKGPKRGTCCPKGKNVCGKTCCQNEVDSFVQNYCADAGRGICCPEGQVALEAGGCGAPLCGGVGCDGAFGSCRSGVCCPHGKECGAGGCCQGKDEKGRDRICWNRATGECGIRLGSGATIGLGGLAGEGA